MKTSKKICKVDFCEYRIDGICTNKEARPRLDGPCSKFSARYITKEDLERFRSRIKDDKTVYKGQECE